MDLWPLGVYAALVALLVTAMLGLSYVLGQRHHDRSTDSPYESGILSEGSARVRLSAKFYLVAMFFVIFDLEAIFIFAWAVAVRETGWTGYVEVLIFITVLLVSLAYLVVDVSLPPNDRPPWIKEAKSERFLAKGADLLRTALPDSLQVKSAGIADDTHRGLERAQEAQKAMRAYANPAAPSTAKPGEVAAPSYKPGDRSDMDRLIKNTR